MYHGSQFLYEWIFQTIQGQKLIKIWKSSRFLKRILFKYSFQLTLKLNFYFIYWQKFSKLENSTFTSQLLDELLQPIMKLFSTYIKDNNQLILHLDFHKSHNFFCYVCWTHTNQIWAIQLPVFFHKKLLLLLLLLLQLLLLLLLAYVWWKFCGWVCTFDTSVAI